MKRADYKPWFVNKCIIPVRGAVHIAGQCARDDLLVVLFEKESDDVDASLPTFVLDKKNQNQLLLFINIFVRGKKNF